VLPFRLFFGRRAVPAAHAEGEEERAVEKTVCLLQRWCDCNHYNDHGAGDEGARRRQPGRLEDGGHHFASYVISFVYLSIYWNHHHHFFNLVKQVDGRVLWANMHLVFWLSLIPFTTGWMGENDFGPIRTVVYGRPLVMSAPSRYQPRRALGSHLGL
jgi:Endosomal/lysosomal potassium channel TMEM175